MRADHARMATTDPLTRQRGLRRVVGGRPYDAAMSIPSSDDTSSPSGQPAATPAQPGSTNDFSRPGFHERDPAAIAQEAALGEQGPSQVAGAQYFYRLLFEVVEDQAWPDAPVGPPGNQWRGVAGRQSTYYLINVATVLHRLMATASPGVHRTLKQRLRTILRPSDDQAYEEALVELEVGGMISTRVSPVLLEPFVPTDWNPSKGEQPMSPDYGVRVPEGLVTVEVTVWHWEAYAAWHRMKDTIHRALQARMVKRGIGRSVRIELPIGSPQEAVEYLWSHQFCDRVCDSESGETGSPSGLAPRPIRATWRPLLHFDDHESIDWAAVAANGGQCTVGAGIAQSFGYAVNPCINDDDLNDALESLRRSIDRKKRQRDPSLAHLVAVAPTFPQIAVGPNEFAKTWEVFGPLIDKRLWPNPKYQWLSGILEHNTNRVAPPSQHSYFVGYTPNPNATVPIPETMDRAMKGEAEFHLMWQRPRRPGAGPLPSQSNA
jgi:hypothetical protein